jgi:undecaprenyl diphosphate synthase
VFVFYTKKRVLKGKIPSNVAIILDGNGRWAQKKGLIRSLGHKAGAKALKETTNNAFKMGVKVLSVFCFSTENWKRDKEEVDYLFTLPIEYFNKYSESLVKNDIKVIFSGDISKLPKETFIACDAIRLKTSNCKSFVLNICINYGSHDEILMATKQIASKVKNNEMDVDDITKEVFENHLYTKGLPPVDLLIRTSNEQRISNFLLWQSAYSELYFTDTLWPDFTKEEYASILENFGGRERRFGGRKEEDK